MQVFVSLLLDANVNIRCKAAGALQSLAVHPANQQVVFCTPCCRFEAEVGFAEHQRQRRRSPARQHDVQVNSNPVCTTSLLCVLNRLGSKEGMESGAAAGALPFKRPAHINVTMMTGTLHNLAVGDPVTQEQIVACDAVPVVLAMTAGDGSDDSMRSCLCLLPLTRLQCRAILRPRLPLCCGFYPQTATITPALFRQERWALPLRLCIAACDVTGAGWLRGCAVEAAGWPSRRREQGNFAAPNCLVCFGITELLLITRVVTGCRLRQMPRRQPRR